MLYNLSDLDAADISVLRKALRLMREVEQRSVDRAEKLGYALARVDRLLSKLGTSGGAAT